MTLNKINPTHTKAWKHLSEHFKTIENVQMKNLFAQNSCLKSTKNSTCIG